jgi:predicted nuclease with TOPRIM domain
MNPALLQQPFFQVTLPLMVTFVAAIWAATWSQNKKVDEMAKRLDGRIDEVNRRLDEIIARLARIEAKLENHDERIVRLEERTSPLARH